jgi:hypothetical protein
VVDSEQILSVRQQPDKSAALPHARIVGGTLTFLIVNGMAA